MLIKRITGKLVFSDLPFIRIARHLFLFAGLNFIFIWVAYARTDTPGDFMQISGTVLLNSVFFFSYAYITAYILFPVFLPKKKYFLFFILFLAVGMTISGIKLIFNDYIFYNAIASGLVTGINKADIVQMVTNTKDMTFIVAIFLIAKYAKDNYHMKNQLHEIRSGHLESEIKIMHNQLDPHVIFNNLNNIYSISLNNPSDTYDHLGRLNELMQYYFYDSKTGMVNLEDELKMIGNYIGLERLRYGDNLELSFEVDGKPGDHMVIPFIFLPLVENCFEHGCGPDTGHAWVRIDFRMSKNELFFTAENSKPHQLELQNIQKERGSLEMVRKRLKASYPDRHHLLTFNDMTQFRVHLKLRLN